MALTRRVTDTDAKHLCKMIELRLRRDNVDCTITNYVGTALKFALAYANEQERDKRVGDRMLMHRSRDTHIRPFLCRKLECVTT
ncbi:hypothetical protein [Burkholderia ambifaria]|jgi:hypothetical protein|uniref:hypothetical protein n=1 Tax=Burkholderia ambifaria TaxID=152480 RepID=UPI000D007036|nr:hypothetical protein [Burkholderia ambifaria]PRG06356.1 hypothetical protein C6Q14_11610 [Burkholderia ambifaria]